MNGKAVHSFDVAFTIRYDVVDSLEKLANSRQFSLAHLHVTGSNGAADRACN